MEPKFILSQEECSNFMKDPAMNSQYGIQVYFTVDKEKAQALLPPPLKLAEPAMGYLYIVNIREPSFSPWYMEGGVGIMAEMGEKKGLYFLGLHLTGPGALMGLCTGREFNGLPKKMCDHIKVERLGDLGHCYIERDGIRLVEVKAKMGKYNRPDIMKELGADIEGCSKEKPTVSEGGCLTIHPNWEGHGIDDIDLLYYDSPVKFYSWDPASVELQFNSSPNDPWGDIPMVEVLGSGWFVNDNWIRDVSVIYTYPKGMVEEMLPYLLRARFDLSTLCEKHQIYE